MKSIIGKWFVFDNTLVEVDIQYIKPLDIINDCSDYTKMECECLQIGENKKYYSNSIILDLDLLDFVNYNGEHPTDKEMKKILLNTLINGNN